MAPTSPKPKGSRKKTNGAINSPMKITSRGEVVQIRSPAEFFAENQNIAGFDNPGKCLYTTLRELVENSLDASESIHVLPEISLTIIEMNEKEFNRLRGLDGIKRVDVDLYASTNGKKSKKSSKSPTAADTTSFIDESVDDLPQSKRNEMFYYKITCKDNGIGMPHDKIPDMLGRVLSGSKYGVRQTRGKFGLGAKMALIWSKKSTGLPIDITSAYSRNPSNPPTKKSHCILDIDIYKNEPNVLQHKRMENSDEWRGSEITVIIGGNWTTYKSRIIQYLQQLAIITPYAQFELSYQCSFNSKRDFNVRYERRSDQMPPVAKEVKHHPSALNNLLLKQLLDNSKGKTLIKFLSSDLCNIDSNLASRVVAEMGKGFDENMKVGDLDSKQIHQLVHLLKQVEFKPPDGKCLSPAGEYNLRLGILKELNPDLVATHTESPAVFEGHSFIIEAGISIGGKGVKEGINVYRFANRIPLLFEGGADVVTRTAMKQINWSSYKIDYKRDKIGVFVSIVSTKIPFKGTGKEYIGNDIEEIKKSVKHVIQMCCQQLRVKLVKSQSLKANALRKKNLTKYIPDVSRAIFGVLMKMQEEETRQATKRKSCVMDDQALSTNTAGLAGNDKLYAISKIRILEDIATKKISEQILSQCLHDAVQKVDDDAALETITASGRDKGMDENVYILPLHPTRPFTKDIYHPAAVFRFYSSVTQHQ